MAPLDWAVLWRSSRAKSAGRVLLLNSTGPGASHPASGAPVTPTWGQELVTSFLRYH